MSTRLTGNESLIGDISDAAVLDFWQWALSNLRANNVRGVFAEWLVAKLLDIPLNLRGPWDEYDLETPEGVKIEIKTAGYLQAWEQAAPSKIIFGGLKGRKWTLGNGYADVATYNADLYVFCIQIETDPHRWNALDLSQWRFYLLTRNQVEYLGRRSISLSTLAKHAQEMTAEVFVQRACEVFQCFSDPAGCHGLQHTT